MGTISSKCNETICDDSSRWGDSDETWFLDEEVRRWESRYGPPEFGDSTLFMDGPEFQERNVEEPPENEANFKPNSSSSMLSLSDVGREEEEEVEEEAKVEDEKATMTSYDRIPDLSDDWTPVRGRARKRLPAWDCTQCAKFYDAAGIFGDERKKLLQKCSRHRSKLPRPKTPPGFWDVAWRD